jgi:hypothetical protein
MRKKRAWLKTFLHSVSVSREAIIIRIDRRRLLDALLAGQPNAITSTKRSIVGAHDGGLITRRILARLQRTAGEVRIIGADAPRSGNLATHHLTLINAIARARHWYEQIASGSVGSMAAIARSAGLADRYVSRLLRCALLAPDIVAALLAGAAPHDLTLAKVLRNLPLSWARQREIFGFPRQSLRRSPEPVRC